MFVAWPKKLDNVWAPFLERNGFDEMIASDCGFDETHMMYKLHTTNFNLPTDSELEDLVIDKTDVQQLRNSLAIVKPIGPDNDIHAYMKNEQFARITSHFITSNGEITSLSIALFCIGTIFALTVMLLCCKFCSCANCCCSNLKAKQSGYEQIV